MGPISTFRWFFDVAKRRPKLVSLVGLGLIAESGRVWIGLDSGRPVTIIGHGGAETLDPIADASSLFLYAYWVGTCGTLLLVTTWFARRSVRSASVAAVRGKPKVGSPGTGVSRSTVSPPVVRRMREITVTRRR